MAVSTVSITVGESEANGSLLEQELANLPRYSKNGKSWKDSFVIRSRRCSRPSSWQPSRSLHCIRSSYKACEILARSQRLPPPSSKRKNCGESTRIKDLDRSRADQACGGRDAEILTPQQRKKFVEKMEHENWSYSPEAQSPGVKESSTTTKPTSEGQTTVSGSTSIVSGTIKYDQPLDARLKTSAAATPADEGSPAKDQSATTEVCQGEVRGRKSRGGRRYQRPLYHRLRSRG